MEAAPRPPSPVVSLHECCGSLKQLIEENKRVLSSLETTLTGDDATRFAISSSLARLHEISGGVVGIEDSLASASTGHSNTAELHSRIDALQADREAAEARIERILGDEKTLRAKLEVKDGDIIALAAQVEELKAAAQSAAAALPSDGEALAEELRKRNRLLAAQVNELIVKVRLFSFSSRVFLFRLYLMKAIRCRLQIG